MKTPRSTALVLFSIFIWAALPANARDAARDLRRMAGYTIVGAAAVQETNQGRLGETIITPDSGIAFKITDVILPPLPLTDVIILAKSPGAEIIAKYGNKLSKEQLMSYRILIDNEAHEVIRVK